MYEPTLQALREKRELSQEQLAALAHVEPAEVAAIEEGQPAPAYVTTRVRIALGLRPLPGAAHVAWTEVEPLLGRATDTLIAAYVRRSREAVRLRREHAGIPRCAPKAPEVSAKTAEQLHQLATVMPLRMARQVLGLRPVDTRLIRMVSGRNGRATPPWASLIGTMHDREVADAADVHVSTVRRWRRRLGLRPYAHFGEATEEILRKASIATKQFHAARKGA